MHFGWLGWQTNLQMLTRYGWRWWIRPAYHNWRDMVNSRKASNKVFLYHTTVPVMARASFHGDPAEPPRTLEVDYVLPKKLMERMNKPAEPLTEKDIPMLLNIILQLQQERRREYLEQQELLPKQSAEIIRLYA